MLRFSLVDFFLFFFQSKCQVTFNHPSYTANFCFSILNTIIHICLILEKHITPNLKLSDPVFTSVFSLIFHPQKRNMHVICLHKNDCDTGSNIQNEK